MEFACDIFYAIYDDGERSETVNKLLQCLDFHALSITLLATAASHHAWDYRYDQLATEWDTHRAQILRTDYNESLEVTIELSLASPTFRNLGTDAHDLLGVVAFFPQGVDEKNLDWLFPTTSDRKNIFDTFCILSLAHRSNGFTISSRKKVMDTLFLDSIASSVTFILSRDRKRRLFTISERLSQLHPRLTGSVDYSRSAISWRSCSLVTTITITQRPTSIKQNYTQLKTDTKWAERWSSRLRFGKDRAGSKTRNRRSRVHSRSLRSLGW